MDSGVIEWEHDAVGGCFVLRPLGTLDTTTYRVLRDGLVKFALEEPDALIVDVAGLRITAEPLLTAFTSAWMRIGDWPGVPILLVIGSEGYRKAVEASAVHRFVPVFAAVPDALAAAGSPPPRRRATIDLVPVLRSAAQARRFVHEMCDRWRIPEVADDAALVATELVDNAVIHARGDLRLRLELRDELLTVAVGDDDPHEAVLHEPGGREVAGLLLVAQLSRVWGCAPRLFGGKVVWAMLPTGKRRQLG